MKWSLAVTLLGLVGVGLHAQEFHVPDPVPWMVEALESGCLVRDELVLLGSDGTAIRAQSIVDALGLARGEKAVRCLLALASWQDHMQSLGIASSHRASLLLRVDGRPVSDSEGRRVDWGWRINVQRGGSARQNGRFSWSSSGGPPAGGGLFSGRKGVLLIGTMAPRIGQGASLWSASAFDDLGGMEGSHRIASGLGLAASRQRGHVDGIGWSRLAGGTGRTGIHWGLIGRTWQGVGWSAALGGGGRTGWLVRGVQVGAGEWRGLIGGHGGFERAGWSVRWGAAMFGRGVSARVSVLKSWTPEWEGHLAFGLDHPDHPAWHSGEWRATSPDSHSVAAGFLGAGLQWKGPVSGWLRFRWKSGMAPEGGVENRSSLRLSGRGHQLTIRVDVAVEPDVGETVQWTCRHRKEWSQSRQQVWALHIGAGGYGRSLGGVFGFMARLQGASGGRWRLGCAQAWGHPDAPIRYITGWDRLPAQAFRRREAHAFLRYRESGGRMEWAIRLTVRDPGQFWDTQGTTGTALSWVGVDFRPGNGRRGGSGRRYIGRAEKRALLPRPIQTKEGHGHHFRHQEWTVHPLPGGIVPGH